jgi:hypothetical protein
VTREESVPQDGDWGTDGTSLWSLTESSGGTWVPYGEITDDLGDDYRRGIRVNMKYLGYYPNVWWCDDHGGMELVDWEEGSP